MKNYYQILGVTDTAEQGEIRRAYLKKAKEFHPDVNRSSVAEAKFKEIQEAYDTLSDIDKKSSYDYNRQFYNYQQPYQNTSEWADYFRQQAEQQRQNQHNHQTPPNKDKNESNFDNNDDEINNQSTLFVILLFVAIFIMAIVIYYVGFWSSLILGGMLYLLYQIYQSSKNTS